MATIKLEPANWQYAGLPHLTGPDPTFLPAPSSSPSHTDHAPFPSPSELLATLSSATWAPCTQFPTEIHLELRAAGKIPDWNVGRGEHEVQWVGRQSWAFRADLDVPAELLGAGKTNNAVLEFEGLDTFCHVYLNDAEILTADNHFRRWSVPVPVTQLRPNNTLTLVFSPPEAIANALSETYGPFRGGSCNLGNRARMAIRKAGYHFRWDWGPELLCMGPDRGVGLVLYQERLGEVQTCARVKEGDWSRELEVRVDVECAGGSGGEVRVRLKDREKVLREGKAQQGRVKWDLGEEVELWWPHGQGAQKLYTVQVELLNGSIVIDRITRRVGFRHVALVQHPLEGQEGTSFFFQINGRPIFCGGSNWIPIDMCLPSLDEGRYRRWLEMMVRGGQNMVRVWGGGVYEPDVFYELCDELGIMVWQDFMFACGVYPIFDDLVKNVKAEASDNVKRLRHHPSMTVWCGNNEDYQMILQWDIDQGGDPLPARLYYEHVLPEAVAELCDPAIPYWRGSPYGGQGWDTADPTIGDVHQWDIWGGKEKPYQDYDTMGGRFVSEFGIPSLPSMRTIASFLTPSSSGAKASALAATQHYPQSKLMQQHNKAGSHERRLAICMNENFRLKEDLEAYAFLTRVMQGEAVGWAYTSWRREWRGPGKEYCAGSLVWQLADCWPVSSWAIADYYYRPKPSFYTIARSLAPLSLGIKRTVVKNRENDRPRQFYEYGAFQSREVEVEVWAVNGSQRKGRYKLKLDAMDLNSGWSKVVLEQEVDLLENRSTELWKGICPEPSKEAATDELAPSGTVVLHATLQSLGHGEVVARYSNWPEPYKFLDPPTGQLHVKVDEEKGTVRLQADRPVKAVWLDVEGEADDGVWWTDNGVDVFPGDEQTINVTGLNGRRVTVAYLGKEKASVV